MNIMKRLTAVTSLTVFLGIVAPTTIVFANTGGADGRAVQGKRSDPEAVGFAPTHPGIQEKKMDINRILENSLLSQRDARSQIEQIQYILQELGYYNGSINGEYGELTAQAVKEFQNTHNINEHGIVGADTKTALYTLYHDSMEAKEHRQKAAEIREQEEMKQKEKARQEAEAKEQAEKAAEKAKEAKKAAEKTRLENEAEARQNEADRRYEQPKAEKTAYRPSSVKKSGSAPSSSGALTVQASGYALKGTTATGMDLSKNMNAKIIAVDPSVIPLGSKVRIPGYGTYTAADTGGSIKGKKIDVHFPSREAALQFGRKTIQIEIIR